MAVMLSIESSLSHSDSMMNEFATRLLTWYDEHGRKDLPWQQDVSAYRIWVSEIMLQQTQVQTVIPYFNRFIDRFPDVVSLAGAQQDDVLAHWSGLGYYARARNLHKAAQRICSEHAGRFPVSFDEVIALPGIGRSTAGAILALALQQRHTIMDGNVKRVLARHGAIAGWPGKTAVAKKLWAAAEQQTPGSNVAEYTQAIMDMGATLCTRARPSCDRCPVSFDCEALHTQSVDAYPGRKPAKRKPLKTTTMILASAGGTVYLERRPETGIWGGLWSFPELNGTSVTEWCIDAFGSSATETLSWNVVRHSFTHYDLDIQPIVVRIEAQAGKVSDTDTYTWHRLNEEPPGGMAAPVSKLINQLKKSENVAHH